MPVSIKEIHVNTVIEKKVVQITDISDRVYMRIKEDIIHDLSVQESTFSKTNTEVKKNER